ncbi:MAG: N-acetylmuramoyl-L-alanine amidase [bacterium]|nr:N-acetylmuramoyl-L-alanine amidase [bacterium]
MTQWRFLICSMEFNLEGQKNKIKTRKGYTLVGLAIAIIVTAVILILVITLFGASIAAWWNSRGEASPNINCDTWAGAPAGYQDKITAAANKAGIQPALLGAIYLSEHNNNWYTPPGGSWTADTPNEGNQGPFQIPNKDDYAEFLDKEGFKISSVGRSDWWNDFDTAAYAAAVDIKNGFKWANKPINSSDEQAIVFAGLWYNTGPVAAQEWANGGYNLSVSPSSKPDWGNPGTQQYAKRTWTNFQKLNLGCKAFTPSAGASYIQACQGGTTTTSSDGSIIVIDPGHGTPNNHAGATGEPGIALEVGLAVTNQLRAKGYTVYMTRGDPNGGGIDTSAAPGNNDQQTDEDNKRRALFANSKGAALIFRIHADSSSASTPHQGYYFTYPTYPGSSRDGHAGPSQDTAQKSEAIAKALSAFMATGQGLTKQSDPKSDTAGTQYGRNLVGSSWSTVPSALIEMFDMTSSNATSSSYKVKMATGIANAIASAVPLGTSSQAQTATSTTPGCKIAGLALEVVKDVAAKECSKGDGCRNNPSKYYDSVAKNNLSIYAQFLQNSNYKSWGFSGSDRCYGKFPGQAAEATGFSDCARFIGYLLRQTGADASFPAGGSSDQHDYATEHKDKYDVKKFHNISELQPGDIVWTEGHIEIYIGENTAFPGFTAASASLCNHGPIMLPQTDSGMTTRIRVLK